MYDPKLRERLYCVVAPTLIVWGAEDRIVPLEHGHAYQAGIEGLRLVTIEKSGHMPLVEQPQPTALQSPSFSRIDRAPTRRLGHPRSSSILLSPEVVAGYAAHAAEPAKWENPATIFRRSL